MSKELKRTRATVVITACALIVSIFGFASLNGSVAWFSNNMEVYASGMSVKIRDMNELVDRVEYYKIKSIAADVGSGETETDGATEDEAQGKVERIFYFEDTAYTEGISLDSYSLVDPARQVLMKVIFKSEADISDIMIQIQTGTKTSIEQSIANGEHNMSQIMRFYAVSDSNVETDTAEGNIVIKSKECTTGSFWTVDGEVPVLQDDGMVTVAPSITDAELAVYIILDYDDSLASYIIDKADPNSYENMTDDNGDPVQKMIFDNCDFSIIITRN